MSRLLHVSLLLFWGTLLTAGCVKVSRLDVIPSPTAIPPDRTDCAEYFGTAFRSETERQWFTENCSAWERATLGAVQAAPPAAPVAPTPVPEARPGEDPRCAQMRGQPYANDADRAWFLANCTGAAIPQVPTDSPECASIRGRPYESDQQRSWFLANCTTSQAASSNVSNLPAAFDEGPDRFHCDEIRGTNYRSANERNWFLQNCLVSP